MDVCTSDMCDNLWGRPSFARVLVEVWAIGELKRELEVVIPSLTGGKEVRVKINVEYVWEPSQCSHCCVFGHRTNSCIKAEIAKKSNVKANKNQVDAEGFTQVISKQWRRKQSGLASSSGTMPKEAPMVNSKPMEVPIISSVPKAQSAEVEVAELPSTPPTMVTGNMINMDTQGKGVIHQLEEISTAPKDNGSSKTTSFVQSIVNSFSKTNREIPMVLSKNRFEALSDDEIMENTTTANVVLEGAGTTPSSQ